MAMRARGGGASNLNRPRPRRAIGGRVYEEFKPMSEWRQQDDYDTLLVYLPGFQKEFIKVTTEDGNILRVRGERFIAGNTWSRFREDFHVPQTCEMKGIRAKFDGGILAVTMPRKPIFEPPAAPVAPKAEETSTQGDDSETSSSSSTQSEDETTKQGAMKSAAEKPPAPQPQVPAIQTKPRVLKSDPDEARDEEQKKEKRDVEEPKVVGKRPADDRVEAGIAEKNIVEKMFAEGKSKAAAAMGGMHGERELLVNAGVAVLVIMALGAWVSYTMGSSTKGK